MASDFKNECRFIKLIDKLTVFVYRYGGTLIILHDDE